MAVEYYDDIIAAKIKKWMPTTSTLRILKPEETKRLFELEADDTKDKALKLPLIALSRNNDIELELNIKNLKSFNGLKLAETEKETLQMNVIPIKLQYQLDIYTKTFQEGSEYLRQYLFKLINNPSIIMEIPYNNTKLEQIANIRVLPTISDTSGIPERLFPGQFTRWTIQLELQDAFLYNIPYKRNWVLYIDNEEALDPSEYSIFEVAEDINPDTEPVETEYLNFNFKQQAKPNE